MKIYLLNNFKNEFFKNFNNSTFLFTKNTNSLIKNQILVLALNSIYYSTINVNKPNWPAKIVYYTTFMSSCTFKTNFKWKQSLHFFFIKFFFRGGNFFNAWLQVSSAFQLFFFYTRLTYNFEQHKNNLYFSFFAQSILWTKKNNLLNIESLYHRFLNVLSLRLWLFNFSKSINKIKPAAKKRFLTKPTYKIATLYVDQLRLFARLLYYFNTYQNQQLLRFLTFYFITLFFSPKNSSISQTKLLVYKLFLKSFGSINRTK